MRGGERGGVRGGVRCGVSGGAGARCGLTPQHGRGEQEGAAAVAVYARALTDPTALGLGAGVRQRTGVEAIAELRGQLGQWHRRVVVHVAVREVSLVLQLLRQRRRRVHIPRRHEPIERGGHLPRHVRKNAWHRPA